MTFTGWLTIVLFAIILTALAFPLGSYMARVYSGERVFLSPLFAGPERLLYRILRVDPERGQDWKQYAKSLIVFSLAGWLLLYLILRTQNAFFVPHALNPLGYHSAPWNVTFNAESSGAAARASATSGRTWCARSSTCSRHCRRSSRSCCSRRA